MAWIAEAISDSFSSSLLVIIGDQILDYKVNVIDETLLGDLSILLVKLRKALLIPHDAANTEI